MVETVKIRSRRSAEMRRPSFFWVIASLVLPIWSLMVQYRFTPQSKLPQQGSFILAPNHYSEIDPIAVGAACWHMGRLPRFMAKGSLFRVPVVGWVLRTTGQVQVARPGGDTSRLSDINPIKAANELIQRDSGVIVYPEGSLTREPNLWPMRGKTGAVRLALASGIPLYPMAHWGAQKLMPRYGKSIRPFPRKRILVNIGEPLDLSEFAELPIDQKVVTAATDKLMEKISELLGELRGETPPAERWNPSKQGQSETGRFE